MRRSDNEPNLSDITNLYKPSPDNFHTQLHVKLKTNSFRNTNLSFNDTRLPPIIISVIPRRFPWPIGRAVPRTPSISPVAVMLGALGRRGRRGTWEGRRAGGGPGGLTAAGSRLSLKRKWKNKTLFYHAFHVDTFVTVTVTKSQLKAWKLLRSNSTKIDQVFSPHLAWSWARCTPMDTVLNWLSNVCLSGSHSAGFCAFSLLASGLPASFGCMDTSGARGSGRLCGTGTSAGPENCDRYASLMSREVMSLTLGEGCNHDEEKIIWLSNINAWLLKKIYWIRNSRIIKDLPVLDGQLLAAKQKLMTFPMRQNITAPLHYLSDLYVVLFRGQPVTLRYAEEDWKAMRRDKVEMRERLTAWRHFISKKAR